MEGKVTITKNEYCNLRKSSLRLNLLENGGVDNWEWYGEALNPDGEDDIDEREEALEKEIEEM